jgi:hypothetical protein
MKDLASLLTANFSVDWYEAVAVVREIADRLVNTSNDRAVPELRQIRLSSEGRVEFIGVTPTDEPVRRMGQLLQAVLAHSDAPVQLRLFITQATAPTPAYESIRDYSNALAFFERPDRSTVLQQLAARIEKAALPTDHESSLTLDAIAPLPEHEVASAKESQSKKPEASPAFSWRAAMTVVLIGGIAAGGAWFGWTHGLAPRNRTDVSEIADRASAAVGEAVLSGVSAVSDTLGLGRIVPAKDATAPLASQVPPAPPPRTPAPRQVEEPAFSKPLLPLLAFDLDPVPGPAQASSALPPEGRPNDLTIAEPPPDDRTIYSLDSPGIRPPVAPRPQIARELPASVSRDQLGRVEIVISKDGSVESAKLLTAPRNVSDGLFLSVAKAWRFEPALKNDVPVRFRKTIWIASPP